MAKYTKSSGVSSRPKMGVSRPPIKTNIVRGARGSAAASLRAGKYTASGGLYPSGRRNSGYSTWFTGT